MELKDFGRKIGAKKKMMSAFDHDEIGYNFRMPNINAALGLAQLQNIKTFFHHLECIQQL